MVNEQEVLSSKQRFGIIGNSATLNHAISVAIQVAPTDMTVLITGENGSGKESFSKIIHQLSPRKHGQFIAINCGAMPEGTIDSELFGHEKGSFTGAYEARKGYFEVTNGGTIFLDEIGEMPLSTQARLLRVLEYGEFIKVGSSKVLKTDVRVVAATNTDLLERVDLNKFREDLYYRLNTVPIFVPPLRQRGADIELLFRKFAGDYSEKYRVKPLKLLPEAVEVIQKFPFPGNIRQLKNLVEQISVLEIDRELSAEKLNKYLPSRNSRMPVLFDKQGLNEGINERDLLYKILFDLKKDVSDLKKMVYDNAGDETAELEGHGLLSNQSKTTSPNPDEPFILDIESNQTKTYELEKVEDISHEADEEELSLEKKEKELIIKALRKNNNKRKHAAKVLGISERTLYRKIKQYEIDD